MTIRHLLISSAFCLLSFSTSVAEECVQPSIEVSMKDNALEEVYDFSQSSEELTSSGGKGLPGYRTLGLTKVRYSTSHVVEFMNTEYERGKFCSYVTKVDVDFSFAEPPVIYVANSVPKGGCLYNEVMKHEHEHLKIATGTLSAGNRWIKDAIQQSFPQNGVLSSNAQEADNQLASQVSAIIQRITDGLLHAAASKNALLDTPENYAKLGSQCEN